MIFVYNMHSIKRWFLIEVTEEGIDIYAKDENFQKAKDSIISIEKRMNICFNDVTKKRKQNL